MKRFVLIGGIWMFLGLIYSGQSFFYSLSVGREYVWQRSFFHSFVFCLEWGLLTPVVLRLTERFRLDADRLRRNIAIHFILGVAIAFVQQTVYVLLTDYVDNGYAFTRSGMQFVPSIVGFFEYGVLMYWSIVFVHHAVGYYRRFRQEEQHALHLKAQLAESQLQSLKMQLQPHFLFNTLNAISVLVKKEPALAQKMIVRLSDCLRLTLERGASATVTLEQELEFLRSYLAIEQVRFGERLSVRYAVDQSASAAVVPTFILQPLVENAVRHGIGKRTGPVFIEIAAAMKEGLVQISVHDGGTRKRVKDTSMERGGTGVGLRNTQERLRHLYGDSARFEFRENGWNGHSAIITIPAGNDAP